jgi:hypothetical protein
MRDGDFDTAHHTDEIDLDGSVRRLLQQAGIIILIAEDVSVYLVGARICDQYVDAAELLDTEREGGENVRPDRDVAFGEY